MIDEELMTLAQAAKKLPHGPHVATLYRWMSRGVRGVRLRTCLIGGRRYTSQEALDEFHRATNTERVIVCDRAVSPATPQRTKLDKLIGKQTPRRPVKLPPRKAS